MGGGTRSLPRGLSAVRTIETARNPVVYGEWLGAPGQADGAGVRALRCAAARSTREVAEPALDADGARWTTLRARRVRRQGADADPDRGRRGVFRGAGGLPINVKCLFEGEEEIGSPSLDAFIARHRELLAADVVLSADGAMWRIDEPSLTVASRGLAGLELTLTGASKDLHSGRHGGARGESRCTRWRG